MKIFTTDKIACEADIFDCFVCEVGSGPGSLTRSVLHAGARRIAAVEIDRRFIPALEVFSLSSDSTKNAAWIELHCLTVVASPYKNYAKVVRSLAYFHLVDVS